MRARNRLLTILVAGTLGFPVAPALAGTPASFGTHVRDCAQTEGFTGFHNPGMHEGSAGWDGEPCQ